MKLACINLQQNTLSFGCLDSNKKIEKISDVPDLPCAKCGNPLLTQKQSKDYFLKIRNNDKSYNSKYLTSKDSIKIFDDSRKYIRPFEKRILLKLDEYAKKYPDCTFEEIFQKPEVIKSYVEENELRLYNARKKCDKVFDNMIKLLPDLSQEQKLLLDDLNNKAFKVSTGKYEPLLKKVKLHSIYADFIDSVIHDRKTSCSFKKQIDNIPLTSNTVNAVIASFIGKSDDKILNILLNSCISTDYFIHEGNKDYGNSLRLCCKCNTENSNLTFNQTLILYPEFIVNIKKQVDKLISLITKGHLENINDYPAKIKNAIFIESNGKFNLNIDSYNNYHKKFIIAQKKWDKNFLNTAEDLSSINLRMRFIADKLKELKKSPQNNERNIALYEHYYELCKEKYANELEKYHK